jgi:ribosome-interacting GTPase 1
MPANLTPQYYKLEKEFKQERDPHEKLRLARELLAIMPKHKGTDKLQAEMKAKISKLKEQVEGGGSRHGIHRVDPHSHIEREGAAQIILIGPPNSGKSSLLDILTHAQPAIADFPFTTQEPLTGMAEFETVHLQMIDTPPIAAEHMEAYLPNLVRQADVVVLVLDVSSPECEAEHAMVTERLAEKRIVLCPEVPEEVEDPRILYKRCFIAAHKFLDDGGKEGLARLQASHGDFEIIGTSILEDDTLKQLMAAVFRSLGVIRIYTKRVGHDIEYRDPIILPVGGTVEDAARSIHKDFAHKLMFAKIWGEGKFEGQRVKNSFVLSDRDVVEFHI